MDQKFAAEEELIVYGRKHRVRLRQWFAEKETHLERLYAESPLPPVPDEVRIKALLLRCLEEHYGSLEGCVVEPDRAVVALRNIQAELDRVKDLL